MQDRLGHGSGKSPHVRTLWACEKDPACQEVLMSTHGLCVFGDIMEMEPGKTRLFCSTHQKLCPCTVPKHKNRNLGGKVPH